MISFTIDIPIFPKGSALSLLSLYIHIPWCVQKCPYCDFNSHALKGELPETAYLKTLQQDLDQDLQIYRPGREIHSIFIGGGTPSLFSPAGLGTMLEDINRKLPFAQDIEITMEANPGTVEQQRFQGFKAAGINRLSLGIQSFQPDKLKALGRIHDDQQAINAVLAAKKAGFDNINIDLMYGLPKQSLEQALNDLQIGAALETTHLSWYQLTLEPNTAFHHKPPPLPDDDLTWVMQEQGQAFLTQQNFINYEVSAYARAHSSHDYRCRHNLNYWSFGDYLGIGAGAHGKITCQTTGKIQRYWKTKHPKNYLDSNTPYLEGTKDLTKQELPFEFMLNALRLYQPIPISWLQQSCDLELKEIAAPLEKAKALGLLEWDEHFLQTTQQGRRYMNDLLQLFL